MDKKDDLIFKAQGVEKRFRQGGKTITVLSNLSLRLKEGERVALCGSSGSGKSTFLSLASGLELPDGGSICFAGRELTSLKEDARTNLRVKEIGIVFQHFHLLPHLTARENISLKLEMAGVKSVAPQVDKVLELVGLTARANHFPHQMSGGEQQRVAIARAVVVRPTLLLADEPTGSLDETTAGEVIELLFNISEETRTTLLLVTHNLALASRLERRLTLDGGKIKE